MQKIGHLLKQYEFGEEIYEKYNDHYVYCILIEKNNESHNNNDNNNDDIEISCDSTKDISPSKFSFINENLFGRKIRISFIGQINVGKSTVLNWIIGERILPTEKSECTYRGIIIKHDPSLKDFYLYKVKAETINNCDGLLEFTNFIEEPEPFCRGVKQIESYLSTKNNDKNINSISEAFIIIKGKLKVFDYIKLEKDLLDKIEFVDLPGYDRRKNEFNEKKYYHQILKFSNSCIYINIAENLHTNESFNRMKQQYNEDKDHTFSTLQHKFIDTCLFLINKSDELSKKKDKEEAKNNLIEIISKIEPLAGQNKNRINISFFSGKYFFEYLENYQRYVTNMENNPIIISSKEEDEIIKKLYNIYELFKNKDFSETKYSCKFFDDLKKVIIKAENLQKENFTKNF